MFGAARDPFAFIRNGIRLHSTEEWRGKKVAGRIRFILSSLVLVDAMERWNGRLQGMEGAVSVEQEGGSRDKGSLVDGLKYGAGTKSQEQLSSLKRNIGREIGRAELFLLESLGERENEGRKRRRRRRTKGDACCSSG